MKKTIRKLLTIPAVLIAVLLICGAAAAEKPGPRVEVKDADRVLINSEVEVHIYCDGATAYSYDISYGSGGHGGGLSGEEDGLGGIVTYIPVGESADGSTYNLTISACVDGEWTAETVVPLTYKVLGWLEEAEFKVDEPCMVGAPIGIEIEPVPHAEYYIVRFGDLTESGSLDCYSENIACDTSWTIDDRIFEPGKFGIQVIPAARGYGTNSQARIKEIQRIEWPDPEPEITCDDSFLYNNHEADFTFRCEGADAFMYCFEGYTQPAVIEKVNGEATVHIAMPHPDYYDEKPASYPLVVRARSGATGRWSQAARKDCAVNQEEWGLIPQIQFFANIHIDGADLGGGFYSGLLIATGAGEESWFTILPDGLEGSTEIACPPAEFMVCLKNDYVLQKAYGGEPAVTVEQIAGEEVGFTSDDAFQSSDSNGVREGWLYSFITLNRNPSAPQDLVFRATCEWGGHESSRTFTLHFRKESIPSKTNVPDRMEMQVGVPQKSNFDFDPPMDWSSMATNYYINFSKEGYFSPGDDNGGTGAENTMTPVKAGNLIAWVQVQNNNYSITKEVLIRIADENGNFLDEDPKSIIPGDVNNDDEIDGRDAIRLMKWLAGEKDTEIRDENADPNEDGMIDEQDLLLLMEYFANVDPDLP